MNDPLLSLLRKMDRRPAASAEAIDAAERKVGIAFPDDYRKFLLEANGAAGSPSEPVYVKLFPVETVADETRGHGLPKGFAMIGTDGGGEMIVLTTENGRPAIGYLPFISITTEDFHRVGETLVELLTKGFGSD